MSDAAASAGTFLMEAFAFRCHPQSRRLSELIAGGTIGEVRGVNGAFGYDGGPTPTNYLRRRDLAGGSILDVGCYTASLTRQVVGMSTGAAFADPAAVVAVGYLDADTGVDLDAAALALFPNGITAQLSCSIRTNLDSSVLITGTRGRIGMPAPWLPGKHGGPPRLIVERAGHDPEVIDAGDKRDLYAIEADTVVGHARAGRQQAPEMSWGDSVGNMELLDRWRAAVGYDLEDVARGARPAIESRR
jgi:predicted dehydrogenase